MPFQSHVQVGLNLSSIDVRDEDDVFSDSTEGECIDVDKISRVELAAEFMKYDDALAASSAAFAALAAETRAYHLAPTANYREAKENIMLRLLLKEAHDQLSKLHARLATTY